MKDLSFWIYLLYFIMERHSNLMDWNPFYKCKEYSWISRTKYYKLSHHLLAEWNVMMAVLSSVTSANDQIRKHWIDIRDCLWIMQQGWAGLWDRIWAVHYEQIICSILGLEIISAIAYSSLLTLQEEKYCHYNPKFYDSWFISWTIKDYGYGLCIVCILILLTLSWRTKNIMDPE